MGESQHEDAVLRETTVQIGHNTDQRYEALARERDAAIQERNVRDATILQIRSAMPNIAYRDEVSLDILERIAADYNRIVYYSSPEAARLIQDARSAPNDAERASIISRYCTECLDGNRTNSDLYKTITRYHQYGELYRRTVVLPPELEGAINSIPMSPQ